MDQPAPTYHVITWGCQMNEEDSEQLGLFLEGRGFLETHRPEAADVVLLNTCAVRQKPEEKVYSKLGELREMKLSRPEMLIAVCGCMAQEHGAALLRRAPYVDLVVGTGQGWRIADLVLEHRSHRAARNGHGRAARDAVVATALPPRRGSVVADVPLRSLARPRSVRAFVPVMYGCDKFCTFCVVPLTRGRERSRTPEQVVAEVEALARQGTREVTLLGQTVNSYGKNLPQGRISFACLLRDVAAVPGIDRIRFTSPYPRDFSDELIETISDVPQVCEHVHLPLQVADDELLGRMRRGYTVRQYRDVARKLREAVPGIALTTDLMLGFPGETDEQYLRTMEFVAEMRFDAAFMFAYSPRPGTKAAEWPDQVPQHVKVDRLNRLIELQNQITLDVNRAGVGATVEVLVHGASERDPARLTGTTRTFKTTNFSVGAAAELRPSQGALVQVRITDGHVTGYTGELVDPGAHAGHAGRES